MNIKRTILNNKKKILYILIFIMFIVFIFRVVQAKVILNDEKVNVETKVTLLSVENYQNESVSVYTTGKLESLEQLDIKSELSAKIKKINFNIGDVLKRGQIILELDNSSLAAQLSQVQANLDQRIAGASKEDIQIYQTAVNTVQADLEKTKSDNKQMIFNYEIALQSAENNLNLGGETLVDTLYRVQPILSNSLVQTDNILGIDNTLANDDFEDYLGVLNSSKLNVVKMSYSQAKKIKKEFDKLIIDLNKDSNEEKINIATNKAKDALDIMKNHLFNMQEMLDSTPPVGDLTQTELNTMKTAVSSLSTSVNTIEGVLTSVTQGQNQSGENLNSYKIAYEKAKQDLENAKVTADNILKIKEASYNQTLANLEKVKASPRDVDLASLRAVISQSATVYSKSIIRAPFDGLISSMPFRTGDLISAGQIITSVVNQDGLQVKAYINQKESILISEGNEVIIEDKYHGIISNISPSLDFITKKIQIIIAVTDDNTEELVIGQYINAKISIKNIGDSQKFIIPLSAVKVYQDKKTIFFIDENNLIQEKVITINDILGDNIEIVNGLSLEDKIISNVSGLVIGERVTTK